jgi:hypothetical protein
MPGLAPEQFEVIKRPAAGTPASTKVARRSTKVLQEIVSPSELLGLSPRKWREKSEPPPAFPHGGTIT